MPSLISAAIRKRPSGTHRRRGRIGGPRGSPIPPATVRGARRRRRRPSSFDVSIFQVVRLHVTARVQFDPQIVRRRRYEPDGRSPSPAGPESALIWNSLPAISCMPIRPSAPMAQDDANGVQASHMAVLAGKAFGRHGEKSRSQPSSWELEVLQLQRPVRPGRQFIFPLGRLRQNLKLSHGLGPMCRLDVPMQSDPVSPPPMTSTSRYRSPGYVVDADRLAGDTRLILLRQEIHREMDALEIAAPEPAGRRGASDPIAITMAS